MAWATPKSWKASDTIADPAAELNRIGANGEYIYTGLSAFSNISAQTYKTDWDATDYITTAQAQNIDDNIRELARMYNHPFTYRDWAGAVRADWLCLNEWENTLLACYDEATTGSTYVQLCGEFNCGG